MQKVNILDYSVRTSQGDMNAVLKSIKNEEIRCSTQEVNTFDGKQGVPYFLFEKSVADEKEDITEALKEIVLPLSQKLSPEQKSKTALIIGTALLDKNVINAVEDTTCAYENNPSSFSKTSLDSYAADIAKELGLNPFSMTIATACTSSINAVLEARNLISAGVIDYAIVVGLEIVSQMMSDGFMSMNLLSLGSQKPFDSARDGLILGEAVAGVLVGRDESPWSLLGGYSNCNAATITAVSESGEEFEEVMLNAMELSAVGVDDITALKAHATSSISNDLAEINAISRIFRDELIFTALKPYVGHTLGACGILEMAIMMACVDEGFIPKTLNCKESIMSEFEPLQEHKKCSDGIFMLNYFGFGGNNTTAIIQKESL